MLSIIANCTLFYIARYLPWMWPEETIKHFHVQALFPARTFRYDRVSESEASKTAAEAEAVICDDNAR